MANKPFPKEILYHAIEDVGFSVNERGYVCVVFKYPDNALGLVPGLSLGIPLTPEQALTFAEQLRNLAEKALYKNPRQ